MGIKQKSDSRIKKKIYKILLIINYVLFIDFVLSTVYYLVYGLITPKEGIHSDKKGIITWIVAVIVTLVLSFVFRSTSAAIKKALETKFTSKIRHGVMKINHDIRSLQLISLIIALIIMVILLLTVNI